MSPSQFRQWPMKDQQLSMALTLYEASLCQGCGQQQHISWDPITENHWEVDEHGCFACKARDKEAGKAKERVPEGVSTSHVRFSVKPQDGLIKWGLPENSSRRE